MTDFYERLAKAQQLSQMRSKREAPMTANMLLGRGMTIEQVEISSNNLRIDLPVNGDYICFLEPPKVIPNLWGMVA